MRAGDAGNETQTPTIRLCIDFALTGQCKWVPECEVRTARPLLGECGGTPAHCEPSAAPPTAAPRGSKRGGTYQKFMGKGAQPLCSAGRSHMLCSSTRVGTRVCRLKPLPSQPQGSMPGAKQSGNRQSKRMQPQTSQGSCRDRYVKQELASQPSKQPMSCLCRPQSAFTRHTYYLRTSAY